MRFRLIDDWKTELHRLWCIRFSLGFGVFTGAASVVSAFDDVFNPWFLLALAVLFNIALIPLSRLVKQEETPPALPDAPTAPVQS